MKRVVVIGGGPGGYSAAFRLADLGFEVTIIERYATLGGVCLHVGCIPSKALLQVAKINQSTKDANDYGITVDESRINIEKIQAYKNKVVNKMSSGVGQLAKARNVSVVQGVAYLKSKHTFLINCENGHQQAIDFDYAILANGSSPIMPDFLPKSDRIWHATQALNVDVIPNHLVVMGGGIIGLEMATVYENFGAKVTIVEFANQLISGADKDLVDVWLRKNRKKFTVLTNTKIEKVIEQNNQLTITLSNNEVLEADYLLCAVGRRPNGHQIHLDKKVVDVCEQGFVLTNDQLQTNVSHIFAIGDVQGNPMLAHKASSQAHLAAENIEKMAHNKTLISYLPAAIPSIAYTWPEIAWVGLNEKNDNYLEKLQNGAKQAKFPWAASGKAQAINKPEGFTKLWFDGQNKQLLGAGIVGENASELIGELGLGLEFGANVEDLALTVHAHPTLQESVGLAGEVAMGTVTDIMLK